MIPRKKVYVFYLFTHWNSYHKIRSLSNLYYSYHQMLIIHFMIIIDHYSLLKHSSKSLALLFPFLTTLFIIGLWLLIPFFVQLFYVLNLVFFSYSMSLTIEYFSFFHEYFFAGDLMFFKCKFCEASSTPLLTGV